MTRHGPSRSGAVTCYGVSLRSTSLGPVRPASLPGGRRERTDGVPGPTDAAEGGPKTYAACASTAGKSIDTPRGTTSTGQVAFSISFWAWALSST